MSENTQNLAAVRDDRSALSRWWQRKTTRPLGLHGHMLSRVVVRLSLLDRVLVLLGRDVEVLTLSGIEPDLTDPHVWQMIDTIQSEAGTRPRRRVAEEPDTRADMLV